MYRPLTHYLTEQQYARKPVSADLRRLLAGCACVCKRIAGYIARGALNDVLGSAGQENVQGETQQKLDVLANDCFLQYEWDGLLAAMASEEMESIYRVQNQHAESAYLLLFDPLDGSSNIDVNLSIGTIFSVLRAPDHTQLTELSFLQPGQQQIAAGYAIYGPQTQLVLTVRDGVHGFTLDPETGEWLLTQPHLRIPRTRCEFAINASNARHWHAPVQRYVDELVAGTEGHRQQNFNMRWTASMVADVHRILHRGGIFMYPADQRDRFRSGKLRLLYEANPMAFIVEQAQGAATNGRQRLLELAPTRLHERVKCGPRI